MKILIAHNQYRYSGGEERAVSQLETELVKRDHQVTLFKKNSKDWESKSALQKCNTAWQIPYSRRTVRDIQNQIKEESPDVIHVHNIFPLITPSIYSAAEQMGVPIVHTLHNFRLMCVNGLLFRKSKPCEKCLNGSFINGVVNQCFQNSSLKSGLMGFTLFLHQFLETWKNKKNRFIALSQFSSKKFIEFGIPGRNISVIPNGINLAELNRKQKVKKMSSLVFLGRLSAEKGILDLLKAFKEFSISNLNISLDIIGEGPLEGQVNSFIKNNPELLVYFHGPKYGPDKDEIIQSATYLVFPSRCYENCPFTILESFINGTPVIAPDLGGIPELVDNGETGWIYKAHSVSDLVRTLKVAFAGLAALPKMTEAVKRKIKANHDQEVWIKNIESIYQNVVYEN